MLHHFVEAFAVVAVIISMSISACFCCKRGRDFLRKLLSVVKRQPADAAIVSFLVLAAVAYGGSKPEPPPVVVQKGIKLTRVDQTPERISFSWTPEDDRIKPGARYLIQEKQGLNWETLASTTSTSYVLTRFTIQKDRLYRIAVDVTENGQQ